MGSQTILDLIAATFVFGSLLIISLRTNAFTSENMQKFGGDVVVQGNLVALVSTLEYDFRKIGFYARPDLRDPDYGAIKIATPTRLVFYTDYPPYGSLDSIEYKLDTTSSGLATWTPNPNDRYLYRNFNTETDIKVYNGITVFRLAYFDTNDSDITPGINGNGDFSGSYVYDVNPTTAISTIQIDVECQSWIPTGIDTSSFGMDARRDTLTQYQSAYWRQIRLAARNLRNR